jgi:hypothetical protein
MQTNQQLPHDAASSANGHSTAHDLFALTDEQILEIEPEAPEAVANGELRVTSQQAPRNTGQAASPNQEGGAGKSLVDAEATPSQSSTSHESKVTSHVPQEPPEWLAQRMKDPWNGEEARELWNGVQQAKQEAAAYRAAFETPEDARALKELYPGGVSEARVAAERARVLDDIDHAYFGGAGKSAQEVSASRAQLAQRMLREDPTAFREMVFEGLRALEAAENQSGAASVGATLGSPSANGGKVSAGGTSPAPTAPSVVGTQHAVPQLSSASTHDAHVAAYAAFEKAANDDLERSVGGAIERTLAQALPNASRVSNASGVGAQHAAPLQARLSQAIRQDVEAALKGDRQMGEQVAQILSGRRLDSETRAQVVRLIGERAQKLVSIATKRVLNDWTQTTLAAHRSRNQKTETTAARKDVSVANAGPSSSSSRTAPPKSVDYRKLSDEQILNL